MKKAALGIFLALLLPPVLAETAYQKPSAPLAALVDAPATPGVSLSPDLTQFLILERSERPGIDELARPELRLAGVRIDPANNGPSRSGHSTAMKLQRIDDSSIRPIIGLPEDARIRDAGWSPDSRHLAFTLALDDLIELWIADAESAIAHRLVDFPVNATIDSGFCWLDDDTLLVLRVPAGRGAAPVKPPSPAGPIVQETDGSAAPVRTYQDLLSSPYDEELLDHYTTSELVRVSVDGKVDAMGVQGVFGAVEPSPDRSLFLLTTFEKPYSYEVPLGRFAHRIDVLTRDGRLVGNIAKVPVADDIPIAMGSVRKGRRGISWRADKPSTLVWLEALDDGDGGRDAELRDALFTQDAPFENPPVRQQVFALRVSGIRWGDEQRAIVDESWRKSRQTRMWLFDPSKPESDRRLLFDRSSEDRYSDPGEPVLVRNDLGRYTLRFEGSRIFLDGSGASPEGDRPFLDEFDLESRDTNRLWQSQPPHFEQFITFLDDAGELALISREAVDEPPNYFVRNLEDGSERNLTDFPHPHPQFSGVSRELIQYKRPDGVTLSGTLHLPPGYDAARDGPLPTLIWAYPREFKSSDAASQVRDSPHRFLRVSPLQSLPFVLSGYAVLDDASMPILGTGDEEPNDTYVPQLVANAKATIDELVRRGVTDPDRVAVGGHSYGAFMTANLLAHSRLFRAGIARSGAYNRTLTPFGFQSEARDFWKASEVYGEMSPFHHADQILDPLLLIHGEADNNSGTFPLQSERLYQAIKGLGGPARLVLLPYESHGYAARESLLHMLWEMENWLNEYVKPARSKDPNRTGQEKAGDLH